MWIPGSAVKSLVDNISGIIKHKPHLLGADVRENLEELKAQLEKLRLLMPNFLDSNGPDLQKTASRIRAILDECEEAVDYICSCCSCRQQMPNWIFLVDTYCRRDQILKGKRQEEAGEIVKNMNKGLMEEGYQVLHTTGDPAPNLSTAPKVGDKRLIGLLITGAEHLGVITSIVWMLGKEKTIPAKILYMALLSVAFMFLKLLKRRISVNANILDSLSRNPTARYGTRSLLMSSWEQIEVENEHNPCIPDSFKLLKTLIASTTSLTLEIKADVWKMPHFRHLHTNASATFPSQSQNNGGNDSNLRTLCYISSECCKKEVFHRTIKLKKLGISGKLPELFESSLLEDLDKLKYLENLKLVNGNSSPSLPPRIRFPKQLTKLTLSNTQIDGKHTSSLGEMSNLEILKWKEYAFIGEQWKTENGEFLRLRHLHIGHTNLMVWEAIGDHFPILRSLEINGCERLHRIPHRLADIPSLQSVRLHSSTSLGVTYSLKRIRVVKFLQTKRADKRNIFVIPVFPSQV